MEGGGTNRCSRCHCHRIPFHHFVGGVGWVADGDANATLFIHFRKSWDGGGSAKAPRAENEDKQLNKQGREASRLDSATKGHGTAVIVLDVVAKAQHYARPIILVAAAARWRLPPGFLARMPRGVAHATASF